MWEWTVGKRERKQRNQQGDALALVQGREEGDVEDGGDGSGGAVFQAPPSLLQPLTYHSGSHTIVSSEPSLHFPGILL